MKDEIMKLLIQALSKKNMYRYDLPTQIKKMCPTPGAEMQKKFHFFYQPYNYEANTKKHMTF